MKIDLLAIYQRQEGKKIKFEYDRKSKKRPAWIRLTNYKIKPSFLRIRINDTEEIVYRGFGNYFYPLDATTEEEEKFFTGIAKDYDSVVIKNNLPWAKRLAEKIKKVGLKNDAQIIDLGAGTGIASEALINIGYKNLTLIDRSSEMLAIAKMKPKLSKAIFIVADVTKLRLKRKYDAIISIMLFNEFKPEKELERVLIKVKKIMKPGALIALVTDTREIAFSKLFKIIEVGSIIAPLNNVARYYFIGRKSG